MSSEVRPLLTIIITAHNCEVWLQETLDSIVASIGDGQAQCEIVIVNDASVDHTQQIIDDFARRYPRLRTANTALRNIGQVRNHALALAQGDYVLMVDGDDKLLPGAVADHLPLLQQQQPDIWIGKIIEFRATTASLPSWQFALPVPLNTPDAIQRFLIHRDFQAHVIGQYFRRTLLLANPFPPFVCYEDTWLFPQLLMQAQNILYSRHGFYLYRKHSSSLSTVMSEEKIRCMLTATTHLDEVLPARFQPLITCHWLDIANRHRQVLQQSGEWESVVRRIRAVSLWRFLLNSRVRTSYKRKMLKLR